MAHNFEKIYTDYSDFNLKYDYYSIMHYDSTAFALNPNIKTIIPLEEDVELKPSWEKDTMSYKDVYVIRKYYECTA
jgi:hypothetical protein